MSMLAKLSNICIDFISKVTFSSTVCLTARRKSSAVTMINELRKLFLIACILLSVAQYSLAYRILLLPAQSRSIILMHASIGEELISRGHDVHIAVPSRYSKTELLQRKGLQVLKYHIPPDITYSASAAMQEVVADLVFNPPADVVQTVVDKWSPLYDTVCEFMMRDQKFMDEVTSLHFDLVVANTVAPSPCTIILPHHLGLAFVTITSTGFPNPWHLGIPTLPSFCEGIVKKSGIYVLADLSTFFDRLLSTIGSFTMHLKIVPVMWGNKSLLERFARPGVTSWIDILHQSQLFLYENDYYINAAMPLLPNVVTIAGVTARPASPLPEALRKIFDESGDSGVIVVSFGATAYQMPPGVIQKFLDGLMHIKQTVIARLPAPDAGDVPGSVKLMPWIPQNDILGHNKTRLFITHCGHNGLYEALYHGVPMIGFPLFAEQALNCEKIFRKGFGLKMDIRTFTTSELSRNVRELLDNSSYTKTIRKASAAYRGEPMTGVEKAAFWVEYVAKYGGGHLRSPILDMPLFQFLMLDIIAAVVIVILIMSFIAAFTVRLVFKTCVKFVTFGKSKSD